jgi:hypothetical protein
MQSITPQWIAKMYAGKSGRDHLGLGSDSSDQILSALLHRVNYDTQVFNSFMRCRFIPIDEVSK